MSDCGQPHGDDYENKHTTHQIAEHHGALKSCVDMLPVKVLVDFRSFLWVRRVPVVCHFPCVSDVVHHCYTEIRVMTTNEIYMHLYIASTVLK